MPTTRTNIGSCVRTRTQARHRHMLPPACEYRTCTNVYVTLHARGNVYTYARTDARLPRCVPGVVPEIRIGLVVDKVDGSPGAPRRDLNRTGLGIGH